MKCQQSCDKDAVTTYKDVPVCTEHWAKLSFQDDHLQADDEGLMGDDGEDTRVYDDGLIVEDEF